MRVWWNGIHSRLKICRRNACGFESRHSHQYGISIMDNTVGFYPTNVGSIPACRTRDKCRWSQLDRHWIANPWK